MANAVQVKRFHFTDLLSHIVGRLSTGDCHRNMLQIRCYSRRPRISRSSVSNAQPLACRPAPTLPDQIPKSGSGIAVHHELNVVVRRIKSAKGIHSMGILRQVIRCVPAMFGYVQSARKPDGIIDDDNLLMMRRAQGMAAVEAKMDPSVGAPGMAVKRNDFAIGGIDHREIP